MPPKNSKSSIHSTLRASCSTDSPWLRCPRRPCQISYHPRNARRHSNACRYFPCPHQSCTYLGTQKQVKDHESGCPYGLWSEEIATTDPLSESPSEVLDILTSPNVYHSYPTDLSSTFSPVPSPKKFPSFAQQRAQKSSNQATFSTELPQRAHSNRSCSNSNDSPFAFGSSLVTLRSRGAGRRATLDPYHPSSKRIFSLPVGSIDPTLRPVPSSTWKFSSPAPPPPTRRLSTYELQRYRPEARSAQAESSRGIDHTQVGDQSSGELNHKVAQLESLKKCYSALLNSFDDLTYLISQNTTGQELHQEACKVPFDEFRQVLSQVGLDQVPDTTFISTYNLDDQDEADQPSLVSADLKPQGSRRGLSTKYESLEVPILTADQLADQVRMRIAESEPRMTNQTDSPSNVFSRKRKLDDDYRHDDEVDDEDGERVSRSTINLDRPTHFMQKLADTTLDLSDEIEGCLPPRCNFKKLIEDAKLKIRNKVHNRWDPSDHFL